jgi:hypothetical protein
VPLLKISSSSSSFYHQTIETSEEIKVLDANLNFWRKFSKLGAVAGGRFAGISIHSMRKLYQFN